MRKWLMCDSCLFCKKEPSTTEMKQSKPPSVSLVSFMVTCVLHSSADSELIRRNNELAWAQGGIDRVNGSCVVYILDQGNT